MGYCLSFTAHLDPQEVQESHVLWLYFARLLRLLGFIPRHELDLDEPQVIQISHRLMQCLVLLHRLFG